ncbi:acetylcholinesterase [Rhypophila decipiens]|uniref:Carboxylic ester hydrolase n=1 Tax=Rhypophila decipiens TaxID=261697 RepID=A0AAN6XYR7_9PEZI|nr:acetylcholinesterase [Rhypophila decipiens]
MRLGISTAILGALTGCAFVVNGKTDDTNNLSIKTTSGTYTGLVNSSLPNVIQWLGIQFGRPPVGNLRFMPPQRAVDPGSGTLSAQSYKPICMQDNGNKTGVFWEIVPEFQNTDQQSEDCLYLNIWGPSKAIAAKKEELLPVIVWVCGGSFKEGGGHAPYQVPDHWIQRTQTHLVVTLNYRLNIFGFPGTELARTNVGILDVRLAVEWLRDNVAGFGGDPERMVLYGQSAGGGVVLSYTYAFPTDPIVSGFIASSAGAGAINPNDTNPAFSRMAQNVGCANLTATEELACMQQVDAVKLRDAVVAASLDMSQGFRPIVDGVTQFVNLTERLEKGLVADRPLIAGFTYNEVAAFEPLNARNESLPLGSNQTFLPRALSCGTKQQATARARFGLTTYSYMYAGNFSNVTPLPQLGGMHSSDLPIVFGTHFLFRGNSTELEWQTSFAMESFWVTFAANSSADPRDHMGTVWPKYIPPSDADNESGKIIVFGNSTGPSGSYVSPVELADNYSGPCEV